MLLRQQRAIGTNIPNLCHAFVPSDGHVAAQFGITAPLPRTRLGLWGELGQPRMADERDRAPQPVALFLRKVREKSHEVELVAAAEIACLKEKQGFRDNGGQTPRRLLHAAF